jgi:hypothetical protein
VKKLLRVSGMVVTWSSLSFLRQEILDSSPLAQNDNCGNNIFDFLLYQPKEYK